MPLLNTADKLYLGTQLVDRAYLGTNPVFPLAPVISGRNLVLSYEPNRFRNNHTGSAGYQFQLTTSMTFNRIGVYVGYGNLIPQEVACYNRGALTEVCRAFVDITGGVQGTWRYTSIPSMTLPPEVYKIWGCVYSGDGYFWPDDFADTPSGGALIETRNGVPAATNSVWGETTGEPTNQSHGGWAYYGIDLDFV